MGSDDMNAGIDADAVLDHCQPLLDLPASGPSRGFHTTR